MLISVLKYKLCAVSKPSEPLTPSKMVDMVSEMSIIHYRSEVLTKDVQSWSKVTYITKVFFI